MRGKWEHIKNERWGKLEETGRQKEHCHANKEVKDKTDNRLYLLLGVTASLKINSTLALKSFVSFNPLFYGAIKCNMYSMKHVSHRLWK